MSEVDNAILMEDNAPIHTILKNRLNKRPRRPTSKEEMIAAFQEEWDKLTPDVIKRIINTMPKRIDAVLAAKGGSTKY
ncbi:hypothetical protein BCR41DRAFT_151536 [Lobosporangium transversale]|uniref:Uncharacterized protein n=1 Tax=Lobosporangium transversale TaxID=64571 RepID=A0A1Y2GZK4_9FUNG|nr:hypothetical protein BCR41DRAFT_151536 [Lobosporangium transversale]ORZ27214.1 hypothetical protein BCR41DRAFT_151536 [Lobosporangium transversale]|eukprot:XP_021884941.1 hypothetical protein BCR41DRAFT_151536 [Lobosporangium transversale]